MKKLVLILLCMIGLYITLFIPLHAETTPEVVAKDNANSLGNTGKIKTFLEQQSANISSEFPYRINLFTQGQVDKNKAGVRIAQTAKQLAADNSGLLFYYELYNHSMRVPHWHANAVEVGTVLNGKMRVTIWDGAGQPKIFTVEQGRTWMIPKATLHSLENIGNGELTFFVAYNSPNAADRDFATAWAALPDAILEQTLGLSAEDIAVVKKTTVNRLSSYDPSAVPEKADTSSPLSGNFAKVKPVFSSNLGSIKRIDANTNPAIQSMALQQTILKPGTLRVPHWYTTGDALLFVYKGNAFFTMMNNEGKVYNTLVKPGDLISIPEGMFHSYLNVGQENLEIYEAFNAAKGINEITLLNGAQHFSTGTLTGATGLSKESAEKIMKKSSQDYIIPF